MTNEWNILNGDALDLMISKLVEANKTIILRECFVEGPKTGKTFDEVMQRRSDFICSTYSISPEEYHQKGYLELKKLTEIPPNSHVNLWFEQDLFCQTNMWFTLQTLNKYSNGFRIFLIISQKNPYSFAEYDHSEFEKLKNKKIELERDELEDFSSLWEAYQEDNIDRMKSIGDRLSSHQYVKKAVDTFEISLDVNDPKSPTRVLREILNEAPESNFQEVFRKFNKTVPFYGFGDTQVLNYYRALQKSRI